MIRGMLALSFVFFATYLPAPAQELTEEQLGPWTALEEQVELDFKRDFDAMKEYLHPDGCFWGDGLPHPVSLKSYDYYRKMRDGEDTALAHNLVPVSVVVTGDVAIINFYNHVLTKNDEGEQIETVIRGHNTWKKEGDRWLLLSTYNTVVDPEAEK